MFCVKCGKEIMDGAAFCPFCGEKIVRQDTAGVVDDRPVYQAEVRRPLRPAGKLIVYRDRTEYVTSSVQKAIYNYTGLVSVRKGKLLESIEFVSEDGHTESCPADRKCIHEAFLYIEKAVKPYLDQRKDRLLSQGVRYSFPSSQGLLNDGVLDLSDEQAEFKAKSGKSEVIPYGDVKSVGASAGTLDFVLFGGASKSFAVSKELRDEVLAFVTEAVAPYLARRREELLAQGIYFCSYSTDGGVLNVFADRVEYQNQSGAPGLPVLFQEICTVGLNSGILELALTNGTTRSFFVEQDIGGEVLVFIQRAIEPYVAARTLGFDTAFGIDERIEFNGERGVFHILRQNGREITDEWPINALVQCAWTENKEMTVLGSVVSGGISLFKTATKAGGNQAAGEEERISSAGVVLTICGDQGMRSESVWFGLFPTGLGRTNKRFDQYLAEWNGISDYLNTRCPSCELIAPVLPAIPAPEAIPPEPKGNRSVYTTSWTTPPEQRTALPEVTALSGGGTAALGMTDTAVRQDELGITKYIDGVARFIGNCPTPMTIAFQGNRVSGGSSILRILFDRLGASYGNNLLWLSARQFPMSGSGEELTVAIGKKLLGQLSGESNTAKQAENLITNLAAFVSGTVAGDSSIGKDVVGGLLNRNSTDSREGLVECFARQVAVRNGKVVWFIDGLNQLAPARAVEILEAARDFFSCKGCVFIIAADYADILAGARAHYSEAKAKSFFDELFKMPFRVPDSSYNMQNYVKSKVEGLGIQVEDETELSLYDALIQTSVGRDTGTIDRLFVSFQLLQDLTGEDVYASRYKRLALFALLCMQTRFRDAYDYAMARRDSVTPDFLAGLCSESAQPWNTDATGNEMAAYRNFASVFAQVVNLDSDMAVSEAECRAFASVLELSSVTSH